jgi:hypothetical protein
VRRHTSSNKLWPVDAGRVVHDLDNNVGMRRLCRDGVMSPGICQTSRNSDERLQSAPTDKNWFFDSSSKRYFNKLRCTTELRQSSAAPSRH